MKKVALEILISTMNQTDLTFLGPMFPGRKLSEFHLLIINQTMPDKILKSNQENIRIINSFEYGLSKSRNLALKNTIGEVALIADDDINYLPDFDKIVIKAFQKYPNAGLILFQMQGINSRPRKKYINDERKITDLTNEPKPSSVEMAISPKILKKNKVCFNEFFGLGAEFPSGEERLFLKILLQKNISVYHVPKIIVAHLEETTGMNQGNEKYIRALSALKYLEYGMLSKLWLLKFVFFLLRHKFIPLKRSIWAYRMGWDAIGHSKEIFKNKNPLR